MLHPAIPIFILIVINLLWAGSYTVVKFGVDSMDPLVLAWLRVSISAVILLLWTLCRRHSFRMGLRDWITILFAGILTGATHWMVITGINMSHATDASLLYVFEPVGGIILAGIILRERIRITTIAALVIIIAGMMYLSNFRAMASEVGHGSFGLGNVLIVTGLLCESLFTIILKPVAGRRPATLVMAIALLGATAFLSIPMAGHFQEIGLPGKSDFLVLAYLTVVCTVVAYSAWVWSLKHVPVNVMYFTLFITPIAGPLIAMAALGEQIDSRVIIGGAFLIIGMSIAVSGYLRAARRLPCGLSENIVCHRGINSQKCVLNLAISKVISMGC